MHLLYTLQKIAFSILDVWIHSMGKIGIAIFIVESYSTFILIVNVHCIFVYFSAIVQCPEIFQSAKSLRFDLFISVCKKCDVNKFMCLDTIILFRFLKHFYLFCVHMDTVLFCSVLFNQHHLMWICVGL